MKKAQAKNIVHTDNKSDEGVFDKLKRDTPSNQSSQGHKQIDAKINLHKQSKKFGQRASGNRGKDASHGK